MNPYEWNYYGAPYRLETGMYVVGDYVYDWYPQSGSQSGDLFILASPTADYGPEKKVKVTDTKMVNAIVDEIIAKGRKVNKEQAREERLRIANKRAAAPKTPAYTAPATTPATTPADTGTGGGTSLIPTWIYDPNASWYAQGWVWGTVALGGVLVAMNWDSIKGMVGMGEAAPAPTLANPRKNKMKKYSNPRKNRKNRRNREEEVEEEVEEIDEDEE